MPKTISSDNAAIIRKNKIHKKRYDRIKSGIDRLTEELGYADAKEEDSIKSELEHLAHRLERVTNAFIKDNMRLAYEQANKFRSTGYQGNNDDYIAAAAIGLLDAFVRWDPQKATFATFARMWLRGRVMKEVNNVEFPGLSYPDFKARVAVRQSLDALTLDDPDAVPTPQEVSEDTGLTIGVVTRVMTPTPLNLDAPASEDGAATLGDLLDVETDEEADTDSLYGLQDVIAFSDMVKTMTPDEIWVITRRYGLDGAPPHHLQRIGLTMGYQSHKVNRLLESARSKIEDICPQLQDVDW